MIATTSCAPRLRRSEATVFPSASVSRNSTSGPAADVEAASVVVRPKRPRRSPPRSSNRSRAAPPNGRPLARSTTLAESQRNRDSATRSRNTAGPKSNSWLPNVATSRPSALRTAIICAPRSTVDIGEGESASPAWANTTLGCAARIRFTRVASRAMPPRRPPSTGSST
ncbi:MAG: hypothetical protein DMD76_06760 [Candidatus Rokuibacteriota bacterium]|nr:MAG: hypothetical protein DMD76_06760 [Candidatus Rokubacteria bacterium]